METQDRSLEPLKRTPLPWYQLFVTYSAQFAEPITATVVYPFAPQFVRNTGITGGDEKKTGYYAGIVESVFFLTEALTVYSWARASDKFGRKPILVLGPLGLSLAMIGFGLSKHFWSLVVFRGIQGVFNGNIGVSKTVLAELSDHTNMADAFSLIPVMWNCGSILGPVIGGLLAEPASTLPGSLGKIRVFQEYPYLLPCLVSAVIAFASFLFVAIGLKETLQLKVLKSNSPSSERLLGEEEQRDYGATDNDIVQSSSYELSPEVSPLRRLMNRRFAISLATYSFLAFGEMSYKVLVPLMYSTSIPGGGLGFSPHKIGVIMGIVAVSATVLQLTVFRRVIRRYGPRSMLIASLSCMCVAILSFPFLTHFAKRAGRVNGTVYAILVLQVAMGLMLSPGYSAVHIIIIDSAPSKDDVATANSVAQITGCLMRFLAPSVSSSLYAVSLERNLWGGNLAYIIILVVMVFGARVAYMLPRQLQTLK